MKNNRLNHLSDSSIPNMDMEQLKIHLRERTKELNCIYSILNLIQRRGITISGVMEETIAIIPNAMQDPEHTSIRISINSTCFHKRNDHEDQI